MKRKLKRAVALVLTLGLLQFSLVGCFGSFPLTSAVYKFNAGVKNSVLEQIVWWIFNPIVYGITFLGDTFVLNLIEFWSGGRSETASVDMDDGTRVTLAPGENDNEAILTVTRDGQIEQYVRFLRLSEHQSLMYNEQDQVTGIVRTLDSGDIELFSAQGEFIERMSADSIAQLAQATPAM